MVGGKVGRRALNLPLWVITLHKGKNLCLHKGLHRTLEVQDHVAYCFLSLVFQQSSSWKRSPAGPSLSLKFTAHNTRATWLCALQRYRWRSLVPSISFSFRVPTTRHAAITLWTTGLSLREGTSAPFSPFQCPLRKGLYCQCWYLLVFPICTCQGAGLALAPTARLKLQWGRGTWGCSG